VAFLAAACQAVFHPAASDLLAADLGDKAAARFKAGLPWRRLSAAPGALALQGKNPEISDDQWRRLLRLLCQGTGADIAVAVQPGDCIIRCETTDTDLFDGRIGDDLEGGVARVMAFLVGIIPGGIVATDHRPTGLIAFVLIAAMEEVAMEE
jgi:hypothetical protein